MRAVGRGVLGVAVLSAVAAGCSFFESSGPPGGVNPFVSDMRVSRNAASCDRSFVISFRYQDAQDDIELLNVNFLHENGTSFILQEFWQSSSSTTTTSIDTEVIVTGGTLDLSNAGRADYTYAIPCGVGRETGTYTITVQLVDEKGHESNTRSDTMSLTSS